MNLSRRSLLTGLIAAPAVIAADHLMPVRLWVPIIYGDAIHDDWEGLQAMLNNQRVNIKAKIFYHYPDLPGLGVTSINNTYLLSKPLVFPRSGRDGWWRRDHFIGDVFTPTENFPEDGATLIFNETGFTRWDRNYLIDESRIPIVHLT